MAISQVLQSSFSLWLTIDKHDRLQKLQILVLNLAPCVLAWRAFIGFVCSVFQLELLWTLWLLKVGGILSER